MTTFTNTTSKRRIASVMLVFWFFALGAGWANACVLQERGTHAHTATAVAAGAPAVSAGHAGAVDEHSGDSSPGQAPCLKVCDDASQSVVKWSSGIDLPAWAVQAPIALPGSTAVTALDLPQVDRNEHPARAGLPLRTRYARLTL